jgi:uncharacterized repeat protein (TIGR03803 family)
MSQPNSLVSKLVLLAAVSVLLVSAVRPAQAQFGQNVLYTFTGLADGAAPTAPVIALNGDLYGTTVNGGDTSGSNCPGLNPPTGCGVVFKLSPPSGGSGSWTETVLYTFTGGADGSYPQASLVPDSKGNLYGTASSGGDTSGTNCTVFGGCGVVFELSPPSGGKVPWTETVLYTFTGGDDGSLPYAGLIFDSLGHLYGTTIGGGSSDYGTVFELSPPAGGKGPWTETVLYPFTGVIDGNNPFAALIFDSIGNLYGTAFGGSRGSGVAFELSPESGGSCPSGTNQGNNWCETVLYDFTGGKDGGSPYASLTFDAKGNLYSTTAIGGDTHGPNCKSTGGCGVVFEISPPSGGSGSWKETVLYPFTGSTDGGYPEASVIFDSQGNLYSTTVDGGNTTGTNCSASSGCGVVFKASPPISGTTWTESAIYTFNGGSDGAFPYASLIFNSAGNLYSTAYGGGDLSGSNCAGIGGCGVVFELMPQAGPVVTFSPTSVNFGNQVIDTTSTAHKVTVTNTGTSTLDISGVSTTGDFAVSSNTCGGAMLPVGSSCKISVTFTPTQLGPLTGTLNVTDNAPNSPQEEPLSGTGIGPVTLNPSKAVYGKQKVGTTSAPKVFTLTNLQTTTLTGIASSTTGDFAVSSTTCGTTLAAKQHCTISVTFTPTKTGTRTGQLSVSDSASNSPQTAALTGTGD